MSTILINPSSYFTHKPITDVLVSVGSYLSIASLFVYALIQPEQNLNFIFGVGIFIFVAEFLSIHSSIMLSGKNFKLGDKLFLIGLYLFFVVAFSFATNTIYPALIFALSLVAKAVKGPADISKAVVTLLTFMGVLFLNLIILGPLAMIFLSMPDHIMAQKTGNASGGFVDNPETLLVWGISYYGALAITEIILYRKYRKGVHST